MNDLRKALLSATRPHQGDVSGPRHKPLPFGHPGPWLCAWPPIPTTELWPWLDLHDIQAAKRTEVLAGA